MPAIRSHSPRNLPTGWFVDKGDQQERHTAPTATGWPVLFYSHRGRGNQPWTMGSCWKLMQAVASTFLCCKRGTWFTPYSNRWSCMFVPYNVQKLSRMRKNTSGLDRERCSQSWPAQHRLWRLFIPRWGNVLDPKLPLLRSCSRLTVSPTMSVVMCLKMCFKYAINLFS